MTYYDLTIDKYLQIKNILEDKYDEDLLQQCAMLAVINECTVEQMLNLPLSEYADKAKDLEFLTEKLEGKPNCPKYITIDKQRYNAVQDVRKFTAGQYIDYNSLLKNKDFYSVIPNLLATFFVPEGKNYGEGYDIMELAEKIKYNMSIGFAVDVCFFFRRQSLRLIISTLDSLVLTTKIKRMTIKDKEIKTKMTEVIAKLQELKDSLISGVLSIG